MLTALSLVTPLPTRAQLSPSSAAQGGESPRLSSRGSRPSLSRRASAPRLRSVSSCGVLAGVPPPPEQQQQPPPPQPSDSVPVLHLRQSSGGAAHAAAGSHQRTSATLRATTGGDLLPSGGREVVSPPFGRHDSAPGDLPSSSSIPQPPATPTGRRAADGSDSGPSSGSSGGATAAQTPAAGSTPSSAAQLPSPPTPPSAAVAAAAGATAAVKPNVLVAEDDKMSRTLIKKMLTRFGYDVTLTEDGEQLVKAFQQSLLQVGQQGGRRFDLICTDINMCALSRRHRVFLPVPCPRYFVSLRRLPE